MKADRRDKKRQRLKAKRVKHGEGKRKQKQGLSKAYIKHIKDSLKIKTK